jgi:hypothetical protein
LKTPRNEDTEGVKVRPALEPILGEADDCCREEMPREGRENSFFEKYTV